jgi:N4-gp56 family major capsid protein
MGKTINFTRMAPLAVITSALSEATTPSSVDTSGTTVAATLAEYGNWTQVGSLFSMTSIDENLKEHVELHGQNAGESIDQLIRAELVTGATTQLPATQSAVVSTSAIHTTDTLTGLEVRRAARTLFIGPDTKMDLLGNSEWLDAHRYTTSDAIERGVIGKLHGVEFVETNNQHFVLSAGFSTSATNVANVYSNFFFGSNAYGIVNLGSTTGPRIYVKNPGDSDTSNPLNQFSTVGWKQPFAAKTLNASWLLNVKTGATDGYNAG